jgi:alpha-L-fucosidase
MKDSKIYSTHFLDCFFELNVQEKQEKGMDEMWGNQTKINRADVRERAALFDDGNYSLFIHWGLYPKIANKWKHTTYFGISE